MFVVRDEQMRDLAAVARSRFVIRLTRSIRRQYPEAVGARSDPELSDEIVALIGRARRVGLTWESSIADFVGLAFEVAPRFDAHPIVRRVLLDPAVPPDLRVRRLVTELSAQDWDRVRRDARRL
jgi:hypothetical protein